MNEVCRDTNRYLWKDRIATGLCSIPLGGIIGAPTSGLFIGYIGEIVNQAAGRPLGEWGGWKVGFGLGELASMAAIYIGVREGQRKYDRTRWQLPDLTRRFP